MTTANLPLQAPIAKPASPCRMGLEVGLRGGRSLTTALSDGLLAALDAAGVRLAPAARPERVAGDGAAPVGLTLPVDAIYGTPPLDTTTVTPVAARKGCWRALNGGIDVVIVGVPVLQLLGRTSEVLAMANAVARRLNRKRVQLAALHAPRRNDPSTPGFVRVADVARSLCTDAQQLDVIVTCHAGADVLSATAQSLTGSASAGARMRVDGPRVVFEATQSDSDALGAVAALELMLRSAGLMRAAHALGTVHATLLDSGWGTPDTPNIKPHGRTVSLLEYVQEVTQRLCSAQPPRPLRLVG